MALLDPGPVALVMPSLLLAVTSPHVYGSCPVGPQVIIYQLICLRVSDKAICSGMLIRREEHKEILEWSVGGTGGEGGRGSVALHVWRPSIVQ